MKQQFRCNQNQAGAITHVDGACLVLAGPGSGKTFVITQRIRYLIETCAVSPDNILVITFTTKAARELRERAIKTCIQSRDAVFGTFHSCFFQILKSSAAYRDLHLATDREKTRILTQILYANQISESQSDKEFTQKLLKEISKCKNTGCCSHVFPSALLSNAQFESIFRQFNQELHQGRTIDFDDMLLMCYDYLNKNAQVRAYYEQKFQYIMIDEFQDINAVQYAVVKLLAGARRNVLAVGDDDQAIYGFRGASPSYMRQFERDFADCKQIVLDVNYRCNEQIVALSEKCISHNKNRFQKQIRADKKGGPCVNQLMFDTELLEASYIVEKVKQFDLKQEETAILFRTNKEGRMIVKMLLEAGIFPNMNEKPKSFTTCAAAEDVLAFLRFLETQKRVDFLQFMNKPVRYIHRSALSSETVCEEQLLAFYAGNDAMKARIKQLFCDIRFLEHGDLQMACIYFRRKMGYEQYLLETYKDEALEEQLESLALLQKQLVKYEHIAEFTADMEKEEKALQDALRQKEHTSSVSVMTFHAAKGLEFDHVFIPKLRKGIVPSKRASTNEELEEERRMFYVAITRAKETLDLTYAAGEGEASPFLEEL